MFNRGVPHDNVTSHNITGTMSRSRKRTPVSTWCGCKSQKRGKQFSSRKFRRREHQMIATDHLDQLPRKSIEVMNPWDLGGDGKGYFYGSTDDEWFVKMMRK